MSELRDLIAAKKKKPRTVLEMLKNKAREETKRIPLGTKVEENEIKRKQIKPKYPKDLLVDEND